MGWEVLVVVVYVQPRFIRCGDVLTKAYILGKCSCLCGSVPAFCPYRPLGTHYNFWGVNVMLDLELVDQLSTLCSLTSML